MEDREKDFCKLTAIVGGIAIGVGGWFFLGALTKIAVAVCVWTIGIGAVLGIVGGVPLFVNWLITDDNCQS